MFPFSITYTPSQVATEGVKSSREGTNEDFEHVAIGTFISAVPEVGTSFSESVFEKSAAGVTGTAVAFGISVFDEAATDEADARSSPNL